MDLVEKTKKIIEEKRLFKKGEKLVLGVSGGVDSVVLLDIFEKIQSDYKFQIIIAHLNHGLRKEAESDENFVKDSAKKSGFKFISKKVELPKNNIEEVGREERYKFFNEVLEANKLDSVVTAHTANDQAETIILNLARGAGLKGLKGMSIVQDKIKRPFLEFEKKEILEYAKGNNLSWYEDETNRDINFSRNRVRLNIIPELEKINPGVVQNMARSALNLEEAERFIDFLAKKKLKSISVRKKNSIEINLKKTNKLSEIFIKEIVKKAISAINPKNVGKIHIESILELLKTSGTKKISLPLGLNAAKIYDKLLIGYFNETKITEEKKSLEESTKWGDWKFKIEKSEFNENEKDTVYLDAKKAKNIFIRTKKSGDFLFLNDNKQKKKLSDLFIDAKIPKQKRENYPIIVNEEDEVLWVPFLRLNNKFAASKNSLEIIRINAKNEKEIL